MLAPCLASPTRDAIHEAALGACGSLCTPSPSLLEDQRRLQPTTGHPNAYLLYDMQQRPWEPQGARGALPSPPGGLGLRLPAATGAF